MSTKGIVAAGHPETAKVAADVLAMGGNVVDAALAGLAVACVAEPVLASLGGGGYLLVHDAGTGSATSVGGGRSGRSAVYDFFTQTPCRPCPADQADIPAIAADFGPVSQTFHVGLGSIATPGVIRGMFAAHRDLGRIPLRQLLEPASALARDGVRLDAMQAYTLGVVRAILQRRPDTAALFASLSRPGEMLGEGETLRLIELADAFEILAIEGDDLFYRGEMGHRLVDDCVGGGGHLTRTDLERYQVERRQPLWIERFGARIALNPPPAVGGLYVALGLSILPADDLARDGFGSLAHGRAVARVLAAIDAARGEVRPHTLEPDAAADALLAPERLAGLARRLGASAEPPPVARRGTTHISVIDCSGNAAALTVSNGSGSGYLLPGTGILLNNMLGETDLNPDGIGVWPADRRMGSMMAPTLIDDAAGRRIVLGSGGSSRIRSAILQVLTNLLVFGMPLEAAVRAPRLHQEQDVLSVEPGFHETVVAALAAEAGSVERWTSHNMFFGGVHAAMREASGGFVASADPRRGGSIAVS